MEKAPSTEGNGKTHITASELEKRIEATKEELATTRQMLAKIPKRKTAVLGQPELDEKRLAGIEADESSLLKRQDYLVARLPLLAGQQEEAAASEAQARLAQLVVESSQLGEQYDRLLATFHENATRLRDSAEQVVEAFRALQSTHDEAEYLLLRFTAFNLEPAQLIPPGAPVPDEEATADAVFKPLQQFWLRQNSLSPRSEWAKRLTDLQSERRAEQQAQAPVSVRGHVRQTVG